jgi:hypothetical protein
MQHAARGSAFQRASFCSITTAVAVMMVACGAPGPRASVTTVFGGPVRITFADADYQGFAARSEMPDPPDSLALVIPLDSISPIGTATEADPDFFPDGRVFAIRGVNPRDAVVMFDRSGPSDEMVVFTQGGRSPTEVAGLCDYYADPTLRLCHVQPSASGG